MKYQVITDDDGWAVITPVGASWEAVAFTDTEQEAQDIAVALNRGEDEDEVLA